ICRYSFFFSSRRRHTRSKRDWSSDVCSSDLNSPRSFDGVVQKSHQYQFLQCGGFQYLVMFFAYWQLLVFQFLALSVPFLRIQTRSVLFYRLSMLLVRISSIFYNHQTLHHIRIQVLSYECGQFPQDKYFSLQRKRSWLWLLQDNWYDCWLETAIIVFYMCCCLFQYIAYAPSPFVLFFMSTYVAIIPRVPLIKGD